MFCSQGGAQFPTGGIGIDPGARERFRVSEGQQIRCDAGADGIVRMEENKVVRIHILWGLITLFAQGKFGV
ncbi:hypothetical protein ASD74_14770 [Rhizobium sp. Root564]|nr:hypothetical protein ASE62_13000 [Rhizobium sp. Leaf202]KQN84300.1 hypothetical protein ASF03_13680 [Rhizobium sp. Leaf68]KQZ95229.1 hypothetical protein ASD74_14770 [Rhizobium sp. Root564]